MADLDLEGNPKKETRTETKVQETEAKENKNMFQLIPSNNGNELVVICKMLEAINKNLALLATTVYNHLNPQEKKNG